MVLIAGAALIPPISLARPVRPRSPFTFDVVVRDDAGMSSDPVDHMGTDGRRHGPGSSSVA
jgi:hypothetical protein